MPGCPAFRLAAALTTALAAATCALALPGIATSTPARYQMKEEQTVRIGPSTVAAAMGTVFDGELVEVHCQDRGTSVGGSTIWDYIQYQVDGTDGLVKRGWVPDYFVLTGTTDPLDGVKQGGCPPPLTEPGAPVAPPPPDAPPPDDDGDDGGPPPACLPDPATDVLRLGTAIRDDRRWRERRAVTIGYGERVRIRGRLTTLDRAPVAGAWVCVSARTDEPRAPLRAHRFTTTDADGSFSYRPRPGPSRRIWFVHPTPAGAVARSVLVKVRAAVTLRGSSRSLRNGETLFMRGKVRGGPHRRGVLVEIQARRGRRWQTFGTTRASRSGRYSFPYTFTRTSGVQRYKLRARVPSQRGYPYSSGSSRRLKVEVAG